MLPRPLGSAGTLKRAAAQPRVDLPSLRDMAENGAQPLGEHALISAPPHRAAQLRGGEGRGEEGWKGYGRGLLALHV